jgi:hypothetical protein
MDGIVTVAAQPEGQTARQPCIDQEIQREEGESTLT